MVSYINTGNERVVLHGRSNIISNPIENEINIFHSLGSGGFEKQQNIKKTFYDEDYLSPREKYEKILSNQGIIGRALDKVKNKIPVLSLFGMIGSNETENIIAKYENGELSEFEAYSAVENYGKNQKIMTDFVINAVTFISVLLSIILMFNFDTGTGIKIAFVCATGGASRLLLEKFECLTKSALNEKCKRLVFETPPENSGFEPKIPIQENIFKFGLQKI